MHAPTGLLFAVRISKNPTVLGLRAIAPTRSVRHRWIDIKSSHARAGTETRPYNKKEKTPAVQICTAGVFLYFN